MSQEKKPEMHSLEWYMTRTAKLAKEGKLPTPTRLVGLLPKQDKKYKKSLKSSESKE